MDCKTIQRKELGNIFGINSSFFNSYMNIIKMLRMGKNLITEFFETIEIIRNRERFGENLIVVSGNGSIMFFR